MREFVVARNPDTASKLPYLLYLPLEERGGMWLKAKESWPRSSRVYCHASDTPDTTMLEVLERVPVAACIRRGPAIDLVLARGSNKRSQFVFTSFRGRPMILWQTAKAATTARPGLRIPYAPATDMTPIVVDTRERYGYRFANHGAVLERRALPAGDYGVALEQRVVAAVERKTLENFATSLTDGSLNFVMTELAVLPSAAVVVEGTYSALLRLPYSGPGFLADLVARLTVRYPSVPIVFAETRKLAEEWTYRFLRAARAHAHAPEMTLISAAPPQLEAPEKSRRKKRQTAAKEPHPKAR